MKQIRIDKFGPPASVARCVDVPGVGPPAAWDVVVDVLAFSINPSDLAVIAGQYGSLPALPAVPGMDGVGRVVACGASVNTVAVGDLVLLVGNETWTQRRRVAAGTVFRLPEGLDVLQAALLKVNPATAWMLLHQEVPLSRGDWVLQTAPLSSVGRAVMQLARAMGVRTCNVVRRPEAVDEVLRCGGDAAVMQGAGLAAAVAKATRGASIRLALDAVGGPGIEALADALARQGVVVNYGMLSREPLALRAEQTIFKGITLRGFWLSEKLMRMPLREREALFGDLAAQLAAGTLRSEVAATYPIEDIASALRHAERGDRVGKVLVLPHGPQPGA